MMLHQKDYIQAAFLLLKMQIVYVNASLVNHRMFFITKTKYFRMKQILLFLLLSTCCRFSYAQNMAQIRFINKDSVYDFGDAGNAEASKYQFEFKNTGTAGLNITDIKCDNADLTFQWRRKTVKPGKKGIITVTYTPKAGADPGSFRNDVFITSNATDKPYPFLHISGAIMPSKGDAVQKGSSSGKQSRRGH